MSGEYGRTNPITRIKDGGLYRPHYHSIIFGKDWHDKRHYKTTQVEDILWTSETLDKLWGLGKCITGAATFLSAGYIARYCTEKLTGPYAEQYGEREPEYGNMSNRPGIGAEWLKKYGQQTYDWDTIIINGKETKPPKYYDRLYEKINPDIYDQIKADRELAAYDKRHDNTPERLRVKEEIKQASIQSLGRKL